MSDHEMFQEQGYIHLKNILDKSWIDKLYRSLVKVFGKLHPEYEQELGQQQPWVAPAFHERLINFRQELPHLFGELYDTMQTSLSLQQLVQEKHICQKAAELIQEKDDGLCTTGHMLRMDLPNDTRNLLHWHQESSYYPQNKKGHGLVAWIPMMHITPQHGSIMICPGSHKHGNVPIASSGKKKLWGFRTV